MKINKTNVTLFIALIAVCIFFNRHEIGGMFKGEELSGLASSTIDVATSSEPLYILTETEYRSMLQAIAINRASILYIHGTTTQEIIKQVNTNTQNIETIVQYIKTNLKPNEDITSGQ